MKKYIKNKIKIMRDCETVDTITIKVAKTFKDRFFGLMGKKTLPYKEGLFFPKCSSIHCFFMKMPIDVIYIDMHMTVIYKEVVKPWHIGKFVSGAKHILEMKEGDGKDIIVGDKVIVI